VDGAADGESQTEVLILTTKDTMDTTGCPASCSGATGSPARQPRWGPLHVLRRASANGVGLIHGDREAEVGDADVAVAVNHHVRRFQVAVQHAPLVRRREAGAQLLRQLDRFVLWNPSDAAQQRREILAVDVLHREEAAAIRVAQVIETTDVLVRHLSRHAQLVMETQ